MKSSIYFLPKDLSFRQEILEKYQKYLQHFLVKLYDQGYLLFLTKLFIK